MNLASLTPTLHPLPFSRSRKEEPTDAAARATVQLVAKGATLLLEAMNLEDMWGFSNPTWMSQEVRIDG